MGAQLKALPDHCGRFYDLRDLGRLAGHDADGLAAAQCILAVYLQLCLLECSVLTKCVKWKVSLISECTQKNDSIELVQMDSNYIVHLCSLGFGANSVPVNVDTLVTFVQISFIGIFVVWRFDDDACRMSMNEIWTNVTNASTVTEFGRKSEWVIFSVCSELLFSSIFFAPSHIFHHHESHNLFTLFLAFNTSRKAIYHCIWINIFPFRFVCAVALLCNAETQKKKKAFH